MRLSLGQGLESGTRFRFKGGGGGGLNRLSSVAGEKTLVSYEPRGLTPTSEFFKIMVCFGHDVHFKLLWAPIEKPNNMKWLFF